MNPSERTIFFEALNRVDPAAREAYLNNACGDDVALRASVEALLVADDQPDNLLDRPPVALSVAMLSDADQSAPRVDVIGSLIGPYRLMEQIGEGGFGLVYVAQQEQPVRRNVALKIVKPGSGSKEIIARFEAERQAVALMDHPNIARVFDAGITADGRPYFVMELVRGVPINEFADAHRMPIRERLKLFGDVCAAVHHAHQKGVIHRDIKPSNVMVTLYDDKPVAKVIDFGIAKAIGQSLTDKTIYTRFFSMIGTPLYMSPEQAEMSGLDVDTRSDIYSLGVLLYELLAGATPFDRDRLESAGLDEMRRIIREEEPLRPSKRLTTLGTKMTTVSASRRVEPKALSSALRGDLDWIAMKALEKDRNRRYDSAAAMSLDIARYLEQQPIEARPPSLYYRILKFSRRNRIAIATGTVVVLSLILGTATSLWQMRNAMNERDQKELALQEIEQFAVKVTRAHALIANAESHADSAQWRLARMEFDAAVEQQPSYYLPWISRAQFHIRRKLFSEAADDYARAIGLGAPTDTPQCWGVAALLAWTGHNHAFTSLTGQLERHLESNNQIESWEQLRSGLATGDALSQESFLKIADIAEARLAEMSRPWPGGLPLGFRQPPPRAQDILSRSEDSPVARDRHGQRRMIEDLPRTVCEYITGLAHIRSGQLEQAIQRLEQAQRDDRWPAVGLVHAPLALAYHATDQDQQAIESLRESNEAVTQMAEQLLDPAGPQRPTPWFDFIELLQLNREATITLTGETPIIPPQLAELRRQALQELN
ncbi:MAG: serine/threonine-protein kinase [Pirellulaceae bacterium]